MTDADPHARRTAVPVESLPLLVEAFAVNQVTQLRHAVATCAAASGLSGDRLDDFVLAVNELITNAVRHGGGGGTLRLWRERHSLLCEVSDRGSGIDAGRLGNPGRPAPDTAGGWGLWLANQLSDEMRVQTGPQGTSVRISAVGGQVQPAGAEQVQPAAANPAE
jgi:serine/threonine-protein kinase RsbW